MQSLSRQTTGVIPIVPTPFDAAGNLSLGCVESLVAYYERCGVVGVTILGVMGEAGKMTAAETQALCDAFIDCAKERLPVIVGVSGTSLEASVELSMAAVKRGAAGVMLQPMAGLREDSEVVSYFTNFVEHTGGAVSICVQDYPLSSGVHISAAAWQRIVELDAVFMLKHEPLPSLQKLSRIRREEAAGTARRVSVLTSNNALYLSQELDRGADGAMVGIALSDLIVQICSLHRNGDRTAAFDLYDALLPIIRYESQGQFGLAIRKEILRRRGVLKTGHVRYPGSTLIDDDLAELSDLLARLQRRLTELGFNIDIPN